MGGLPGKISRLGVNRRHQAGCIQQYNGFCCSAKKPANRLAILQTLRFYWHSNPARNHMAVPAPYFNLGSHHREVTTNSESAQTWFDRGLIWTYGFNHEEAIRCFENALEEDPTCANIGIFVCIGRTTYTPQTSWKTSTHESFCP